MNTIIKYIVFFVVCVFTVNLYANCEEACNRFKSDVVSDVDNSDRDVFRYIAKGESDKAIKVLDSIEDVDGLRSNSRNYYVFGLVPSAFKPTDYNMPVLIFSFLQKEKDVLKYLLDVRHANINVVDEDGNTVIHHLAMDEYGRNVFDMKALLIDYLKGDVAVPQKINVNIINKAGDTPLHIAIVDFVKNYKSSVLSIEKYFGDITGYNMDDYKGHPLVKYLVDAGADPHIKDKNGDTVFDIVDALLDEKEKALLSFKHDRTRDSHYDGHLGYKEHVKEKIKNDKMEIYKILNKGKEVKM